MPPSKRHKRKSHKRKKLGLKIKIALGAIGVCLLFVCVGSFALFTSGTKFSSSEKFLVVDESDNISSTLKKLEKDSIYFPPLAEPLISLYYRQMERKDVYPGKYKIAKGMSAFSILNSLYKGKQYTIKLVITKFRLWGDFIDYLRSKLPIDSAAFSSALADLADEKNIEFSEKLFAYIIPDTYYFYWTSSPERIAGKLYDNYLKFWNDERLHQALEKKLSPQEVYALASLTEEETNNNDEKLLIASVFINRLRKGMYLGSDPSIKYSHKDFKLTRILYKHLHINSPFNTYRNLGLPPAPICIPSIETIEAVLNAPETNYLYFVGDPEDISKLAFTTNFEDHKRLARKYINRVYSDKTKPSARQ